MCGLAGMMGKEIWAADRKMFRELLYITALRGTDSTGLMTANVSSKKKWVEMDKAAIPAPSFIRSNMATQWPMLDDYSADVFMAHCRDATVGSVKSENAHPFNLSKLVGAHNGTLVDAKYRPTGGTKTDSQLMFEDMERLGVKETLENMSQNSAFALSVYEKGGTTVRLARNPKRPLFIALNITRTCMYWASEQEMLELVAARNGIDIKVYYLASNSVYTFDFHKMKKGDVTWWNAEDLEYKTPAPSARKETVWVPDPTMTTNADMSVLKNTTESNRTVGHITVGGVTTAIKIGHPEQAAEEKNESYFDSVFDKALTEADFDSEGKPYPHAIARVNREKAEALNAKGSPIMEDEIPAFLKTPAKTKAKDDGPNYEAEGADGEMWWDTAECVMCNRHLAGKDLDTATHIKVGDEDYYSCQVCDDKVAQDVEDNRRSRRPPLDETKAGVTTH